LGARALLSRRVFVLGYDLNLPATPYREQWPFVQRALPFQEKDATFPGRFFRSFRRLFGGR
jgi:hypothetical protein